MRILLFVAIIFLSCSAHSYAQSSDHQALMEAIRRSHIEGNVPAAADFNKQLDRDLLAYARASIDPSVTLVQSGLLRKEPTQVGIAYPKYYVWIKALSGPRVLREGAARIQAVDRTHFEVTHFLPTEEIKAEPDKINMIFPAPLVPGILALAGAK